MKTFKIVLGLALLALVSACAENSGKLYASGDYYNSFGRGYYQPFQDGKSYHYHDSYLANAKAVQDYY